MSYLDPGRVISIMIDRWCYVPRSERTGKYKPDANDPEFLVYRSADEHCIKDFCSRRWRTAIRCGQAKKRD